jgi:hypothetical protein
VLADARVPTASQRPDTPVIGGIFQPSAGRPDVEDGLGSSNR